MHDSNMFIKFLRHRKVICPQKSDPEEMGGITNSTTLPYHRSNESETIALLKKYNVDERLKLQKEWPFESK